MEVTCKSCSTLLRIPDDRLPKGVPSVTGKCPKCQQPVEIRLVKDGAEGGAATATAAAPHAESSAAPAAPAQPAPAQAAAPPPAQPGAAAPAESSSPGAEAPAEEEPAGPATAEDFLEGRKLAMACFDSAEQRAQVKAALEGAGYTVHAPAKAGEALHRLRRDKYEVLLLHEEYGGSPEKNVVLKALQPMPMPLRRHLCVGLVGKAFQTMDNALAFAKSANFVVSERELDKVSAISRQAVADNDQFYRLFREALHEAGRV